MLYKLPIFLCGTRSNNKGVIIGVVYNYRSVLFNAAKGSIIQYIMNINFYIYPLPPSIDFFAGGVQGTKHPVGAKRPGAKRPGTKCPGGETSRGGNGFGAKRPGPKRRHRCLSGPCTTAVFWGCVFYIISLVHVTCETSPS